MRRRGRTLQRSKRATRRTGVAIEASGSAEAGGCVIVDGGIASASSPATGGVTGLTGANCARWVAAQFAGNAGDGHGRCSTPINEPAGRRSEEHKSELQSLMRISYAVFCLKKT